ncbi:VIT1/CCC1 transporter family protein [Pseudooceanicola nanhaiensis]|uniref:VIT1/CCC1 transporter family protein n=1 Tax=Pseudooceanicola nanhaiensis TaxID=375761 RepID=UPI001CD2B175|nr:VIT1/CCC1 transporter family protein [Pseudooceanicola nanhaiensis]MCA0921579.1 VIT1/CCC1 transporter family protein [Pseudooceanicola nanhaiensis]
MTTVQPDDAERPLGRVQEYLKQIVYGGNDGIVTTFAIVAGFAGAGAEGAGRIGGLAVLVFGLANLFADAVSMGMGDFLSDRARADLYRARLSATRRTLRADPRAAIRAVSEALRSRGLPEAEAAEVGAILARHPDTAADLHLTITEGMTPPDEAHPFLSGLVTFCSFVLFGSVPLLPYFVQGASGGSFGLSLTGAAFALAGLGLLRWYATGLSLLRSIGETLAVGAVCALVAFLVGFLVGA